MTTISERWVRVRDGEHSEMEFRPDDDGRLPIHIEHLRELLGAAGYVIEAGFYSVAATGDGSATDDQPTTDAEPGGSVDVIVASLRAELEELRATDVERPGQVRSIASAWSDVEKAEADLAEARAYALGKEKRALDVELVIERLS